MSFRAPHDWVGPTPWEDIKAAFEERCPDGMFGMRLQDRHETFVATMAWNQGIDSRLEAITKPPNKGRWLNKDRTAIALSLDITGLLVFVRRLYEYWDGTFVASYINEPEREVAGNLRSAILQSLGIEEV